MPIPKSFCAATCIIYRTAGARPVKLTFGSPLVSDFVSWATSGTVLGNKVAGLVAHQEGLVVLNGSICVSGLMPAKHQAAIAGLFKLNILWLLGN